MSTTKDIGNRFKIDDTGKLFLKSSSPTKKSNNNDGDIFSEW